MRTVHTLSLLGVIAVAGLLFFTSTSVDATVSSVSKGQPGMRLVGLETKIIEVNHIAMTEAGIRLNSINVDQSDPALTEKALQLLRAPDETSRSLNSRRRFAV